MRAEKRLIRRNGVEMFERNRWYWHERLLGREGTHVEVRWDPRNLGKILIYTREGFLCEAFNQELLGFHATAAEFRRYKQMKKLQREVAMAQLALMHMAAEGISMLEAATGRTRPKRLHPSRMQADSPPEAPPRTESRHTPRKIDPHRRRPDHRLNSDSGDQHQNAMLMIRLSLPIRAVINSYRRTRFKGASFR